MSFRRTCPRGSHALCRWRNRSEFLQGRPAIKEFLTRKWQREQGYRWVWGSNKAYSKHWIGYSHALKGCCSCEACACMSLDLWNALVHGWMGAQEACTSVQGLGFASLTALLAGPAARLQGPACRGQAVQAASWTASPS